MGACPEWYPLVKAARYLGVAPWELLKQPRIWFEWALTAQAVENEAQTMVLKKGAQ